MILELVYIVICVLEFLPIIQAAPPTQTSFAIIWIPVVIVALLLAVALILCYCFFRPGPYQELPDMPSSYVVDHVYQRKREDERDKNLPNRNKNVGIPIGLRNVDGNCYMNSALQAMASSQKIIQQFMEIRRFIIYSDTLKTLTELLKGINNESENATIESNSKLMKNLMNSILWSKTSQQDVLDLMSAIVNAVGNDLKQAAPEVLAPMKFVMVHRTRGLDSKDSLQHHIALCLSLDGSYHVRPGVKLESLLNNYITSSNIDGESLKSTQTLFYEKLPNVLVLQISANHFDPTKRVMIKPTYFIQYDQIMQLKLPVVKLLDSDEVYNENAVYQLNAVINHNGNYQSGHYVTYRKFRENWFLADDENVKRYEFDNSISPYVLIYEKISSDFD